MSNENVLIQQIAEAEAVVNELRKQLDAQRKGERTQAITVARELIKSHDLTAAELGFGGKIAAKRTTTDKRNVVAPKYQDPDSAKTWTGRGKSPAWLASQVAAGRTKEDFLIRESTESTVS